MAPQAGDEQIHAGPRQGQHGASAAAIASPIHRRGGGQSHRRQGRLPDPGSLDKQPALKQQSLPGKGQPLEQPRARFAENVVEELNAESLRMQHDQRSPRGENQQRRPGQ